MGTRGLGGGGGGRGAPGKEEAEEEEVEEEDAFARESVEKVYVVRNEATEGGVCN